MSDVGQFLFVTMDFGGNVPPIVGLVRRLAARGHAVRVLADRPLRARVESAGGAFKPVPSALEWDETKGRAIEDNLEFFFGQRFDAPLNRSDNAQTGDGYRAFIWPYFMQQENAADPAIIGAAWRALDAAGLGIADVDVVTTHNPFAVNDLYFSRQTGFSLHAMNPYGCSLVYGHPQAPTGMRLLVELIETLRERGGGTGLFTGCAAGETGAALVIRVED